MDAGGSNGLSAGRSIKERLFYDLCVSEINIK